MRKNIWNIIAVLGVIGTYLSIDYSKYNSMLEHINIPAIIISVFFGGIIYFIGFQAKKTVKEQINIEFTTKYDELLEVKKSENHWLQLKIEDLQNTLKTTTDCYTKFGVINNALFLAIVNENCKTTDGNIFIANILYPILKDQIINPDQWYKDNLPENLFSELKNIALKK